MRTLRKAMVLWTLESSSNFGAMLLRGRGPRGACKRAGPARPQPQAGGVKQSPLCPFEPRFRMMFDILSELWLESVAYGWRLYRRGVNKRGGDYDGGSSKGDFDK